MAFQMALFSQSPSPFIRSEPPKSSSSSFNLIPHLRLTRKGFAKPINSSPTISNETIPSVSSPKQLPAHLSHLSKMLTSSDVDGGELVMDSSLQPLVQKLTFDDWVALVLDLGEKDFSVSLKVLHSLRGLIQVDGSKNVIDGLETPVIKVDFSKEIQDSDEDLIKVSDTDKDLGSDGDSNRDSTEYQGPEMLFSSSSSISKMYTSLVKVLARNKRFDDVERLQAHMKKDSVDPDCDFYDALLKSYAYEGLLPKVSEVLEVMKKVGFQPTQFTYEKVAFAYVKQNPPDMNSAMVIIKDMMEKKMKINAGLFKNLMKCYWMAKDIVGAEAVLAAMQASGHTPDLKMLFKVVQLHGYKGNHKRIVELMDHMNSKWGIRPNTGIFDALLIAYCRASLMDEAKKTFLKYKEVLNTKPTLVAFNVLIHGYGKQGLHKEVLEVFKAMQENNYKPTEITYNSIIYTLAQAQDFKKSAQLLRRLKREGGKPTTYMYLAVIRCFTKCNMTRDGHKLFNSMKNSCPLELNEVVYGASMVMYVEGGWYRHAATLLESLESKKIGLDASAQASLVRSFGILGCELNPLSKSIKESSFEICKLLTSLFMLGPQENLDPESKVEPEDQYKIEPEMESELLEAVYSFLEKCKVSQTEMYNAFLDCFWKRGYKNVARQLLNHAKEKGVLDGTQPELDDTKWTLDVKHLSLGGAMAAITNGLSSVNAKEPQEDTKVEIITGDECKLETIQDNKYVRNALRKILKDLNSPFMKAQNDSKRLEARAVDVVKWLSKDEVREATGVISLVH